MITVLAIIGGILISLGWISSSDRLLFWVYMAGYVASVAIIRWPR